MVFVPNNDNISRQQLERAQFAGIRSALGYRNSTPTNVMLAEAKVTSIKERAKLLAKNWSIKLLAFGEESLKKDIKESSEREVRNSISTPWRKYTTLTDSWLKCVKYKEIVNVGGKYPIFNLKFWDATNSIYLDITTGKESEKYKYNQEKIIKEFLKKHGLEDKSLVIFTDGSKNNDNLATGCSFFIESLEMGFYASINKQCNNFSAEAQYIQ